MAARLIDLDPALHAAVTAALATLEVPGAVVILAAGASGDGAAQIARLAADLPAAQPQGADLRSLAQVIWLLPSPVDAVLTASLRAAARTHAPHLRVNGLVLGPRRAAPPAWQAAWHAAQPHPAPPEADLALRTALSFLIGAGAVTGQILHLPVAFSGWPTHP